jgi:hypothetical protein
MVTTAAGKATGDANTPAPTNPITTPIVLNKRKNLGVGAVTRCASVRSAVGTLSVKLLFFIMNQVIKDRFKLFHFGLQLTNPLVNQLQPPFEFALDELYSRLNLGNILLHSPEVNMQQSHEIDHQRQQYGNEQSKQPG